MLSGGSTAAPTAAPTFAPTPCYHDPCIAGEAIWGDVDGDCRFDGRDVTWLRMFVLNYTKFANGTGPNPFLDPEYADVCDHRRRQMNPTHDLLEIDDPSDPRYGMPAIDEFDVQTLQLSLIHI